MVDNARFTDHAGRYHRGRDRYGASWAETTWQRGPTDDFSTAV